MSAIFDIGDIGDENFHAYRASTRVRDSVTRLDAGATRCIVHDPFHLIRTEGELGKWLQGKTFQVSVRRTIQLWGEQRGENRYSLWLELEDAADIMWFKLRWFECRE